ncbi:sigma factor-like helix-turn-helix DNA-binding protein [Streptomyces sp. NPDC001761]
MVDDDWLIRAWQAVVDERARTIAEGRAEGRTLEDIGADLKVSRERVRQIMAETQRQLASFADVLCKDWRDTVRTLGECPAVRRSSFAATLDLKDHLAVELLLAEAGLGAPRTWAGPLRGWWTARLDALDMALKDLTTKAPLLDSDLDDAAAEAGVPSGIPLAEILAHPQSRVTRSAEGHWVRRQARGRDAAYLWLLNTGHPCPVEELVGPMSVATAAAAREALRRDDRFTQLRPEGTWALSEWSHLRITPYKNAVEALVGVVTEFGPLSRAALFAKVREIYPVSAWRLTQCLLSDQIGETDQGLIDLVSRGARPIEEEEPAHPDTMAVEGDFLGARITVDRDVLRGSGIRVNSWLTWRLGLRQAPMSRTFATAAGHVPLVVRRDTSTAQISSLRRHALELKTVEGCVLLLLLHLVDGTAQVSHGCAWSECPARTATDSPPPTGTG